MKIQLIMDKTEKRKLNSKRKMEILIFISLLFDQYIIAYVYTYVAI